MDFSHTFTINLSLVIWTHDDLNLPLTGSKFCFPSDHFYINLPSITWTNWSTLTSQKMQSKTLNFNNLVLSVISGQSSLNTVSSTEYLSRTWGVHVTWILSPSYFLIVSVSYFELLITWTPASSNYFRFPLKVRVIASQPYFFCKVWSDPENS